VRIWELMIRDDLAEDLADPDRGFYWICRQPWSGVTYPTKEENGRIVPDSSFMTSEARTLWTNGWLAFRSLASRLKPLKMKARSPGRMADANADDLFRHYLGMAIPTPRVRREHLGESPIDRLKGGKAILTTRKPSWPAEGQPSLMYERTKAVPVLTRRNFGGVILKAAPLPADNLFRKDMFALEINRFWQVAFISLIADEFDPVCATCGDPLPPTKTGRPSREKVCPRCRRKIWHARLPVTERRRREAEKKRRQRSRSKGT
jgi:hypothetical protein